MGGDLHDLVKRELLIPTKACFDLSCCISEIISNLNFIR